MTFKGLISCIEEITMTMKSYFYLTRQATDCVPGLCWGSVAAEGCGGRRKTPAVLLTHAGSAQVNCWHSHQLTLHSAVHHRSRPVPHSLTMSPYKQHTVLGVNCL